MRGGNNVTVIYLDDSERAPLGMCAPREVSRPLIAHAHMRDDAAMSTNPINQYSGANRRFHNLNMRLDCPSATDLQSNDLMVNPAVGLKKQRHGPKYGIKCNA
jgi:hypothetical protein